METKFTKGPWHWEVNEKHKDINLCGSGIEVMRFQRWGMQSAMPTFTKHNDDTFKLQGMKVTDLSEPVKGREHHQARFKTINHPDAHLIAAAPDMYEMIQNILDERKGVARNDYVLDDEIEQLLARARGEQ